MGTWPQQKQNENTKKKRNPFLSGGFIKCFRGVAFYFFKDKGSDWKKKTKNTCFPPCIIPDLGGTPVLSEDGFVVESRGLGYAWPPLRELPRFGEKCGSASVIFLEALEGGKEHEKLFRCAPGKEAESARSRVDVSALPSGQGPVPVFSYFVIV